MPQKNFDIKTKISEAQDRYDQNRQSIVEFQDARDGLPAKYGEACVAAVMPYADSGVFADLEEDVVVTDMLDNPDRVCTDNPTTARSAAREVRYTIGNLLELEAYDFDAQREKIEAIKKNKRKMVILTALL